MLFPVSRSTFGGRVLLCVLAVVGFWPAFSAVSWWVPSEDGMRKPVLFVGVVGILVVAGLGRVPGVTGGIVAMGLLVGMPLLLLGSPVLAVVLWACLVTQAVCIGVRRDPVTGSPRLPTGALIYFACISAFCLTDLPYRLWPWTAIRAEIATQLRESAYDIPSPELLPDPESPWLREFPHPLFRLPIAIGLDSRGPVGPNARSCRMFFGDGRFAYVKVDDPSSFLSVGD
jgi:hypothetical protein